MDNWATCIKFFPIFTENKTIEKSVFHFSFSTVSEENETGCSYSISILKKELHNNGA